MPHAHAVHVRVHVGMSDAQGVHAHAHTPMLHVRAWACMCMWHDVTAPERHSAPPSHHLIHDLDYVLLERPQLRGEGMVQVRGEWSLEPFQ